MGRNSQELLLTSENRIYNFEHSMSSGGYPDSLMMFVSEIVNPLHLEDASNLIPIFSSPTNPELVWAPDSIFKAYVGYKIQHTFLPLHDVTLDYEFETDFPFVLPKPADISLTLWRDEILLETLVEGSYSPGAYYVRWLPKGVENLGNLTIRFSDDKGNSYNEHLFVKPIPKWE